MNCKQQYVNLIFLIGCGWVVRDIRVQKIGETIGESKFNPMLNPGDKVDSV
jgi:hypothetical protein